MAESSRVGVRRSNSTKTPRSVAVRISRPERLPQSKPCDTVIIRRGIAAGEMNAPFPVKDIRPWPGHPLEHHKPQCPPRHINSVAHRISA